MMTGGYMCGEITGSGGTLYVQTEKDGIFRGHMSDTGRKWTAIGGPSNDYDTRALFVTGCMGQILLAFDNSGDLWKYDDGTGKSEITIAHPVFNSISSCSNLTKAATFTIKGCI